LASTESQRKIIVHDVRGVGAFALAFATHASAWHGVAGAQSASCVHASSETTGAHRAHPQSGSVGRESLGGAASAVAVLDASEPVEADVGVARAALGSGVAPAGGGAVAQAAAVATSRAPIAA
jgi:hypothetical protein